MDTIPLPEGITLMTPAERCWLAAEGYSELGVFDEAQREHAEYAEHRRAEWEALPQEERERRTRYATEHMPSLAAVFGWDEKPAS